MQLLRLDERARLINDVLYDKRNRQALVLSAPAHLALQAKERLLAVAAQNVCYNPVLLEVAQTKAGLVSIFAGIQETVRLGIEIGGSMGESWLVPFNNTKLNAKLAVLIIGYKGMINICERAKCDVMGYPVFQGDEFSYRYGDDPRIFHVPSRAPDQTRTKDSLVATYAVGQLRSGHRKRLVLERHEIEKHRARSAAARQKDSPWNHDQDYIPMAMKTAVRALFPQLPKTTDIARALEADRKTDVGEPQRLNQEVYNEEQRMVLPDDLQEPADTRSALDRLADTLSTEGKAKAEDPGPPADGLDADQIKWS